MITVDSAGELTERVGTVLGHSGWVTMPAERIAAFGALTGDEHWVHVDRERAKADSPFGDVLAHGFLLLSLVTGLANECYEVRRAERWTNYGLDRVRFTAPVTPADSLRLELTLDSLEETTTGFRLVLGCLLERQGSDRPAMVADWIVLITEGDSR
ncbi:MaoC family dehydratase [Herbiconiux sp. UC225_62]|uniref:MaoC family dehydratase n=1 Tax=Herbiconiux sp. UC225_62 TaxID=3350168 RepID=UPI0036D3FB95